LIENSLTDIIEKNENKRIIFALAV
jgi:hypothetical protein